MKHLIIFAHPNPRSFNRAILDAFTGALLNKGHDVLVRDLYAMGFQPVLSADELKPQAERRIPEEVRAEQSHVAWADVLTFIFPLWWAGMPAIARGWVERVFVEGFAYTFGKNGLQKLLSGKKVLTITTLGDTEENYRNRGFFDAMNKLMDGIMFEFPGMTVLGHTYFGSVPLVSDAERKKMLDEVRKLAAEFPG